MIGAWLGRDAAAIPIRRLRGRGLPTLPARAALGPGPPPAPRAPLSMPDSHIARNTYTRTHAHARHTRDGHRTLATLSAAAYGGASSCACRRGPRAAPVRAGWSGAADGLAASSPAPAPSCRAASRRPLSCRCWGLSVSCGCKGPRRCCIRSIAPSHQRAIRAASR